MQPDTSFSLKLSSYPILFRVGMGVGDIHLPCVMYIYLPAIFNLYLQHIVVP